MLRSTRWLSLTTTQQTAKLRRDIITGRWVVFNTGRRNRPNQFGSEKHDYSASSTSPPSTQISAEELEKRQKVMQECPFCPGNEHKTPEPLICWDENCNSIDPSSQNWATRVVRNRYPAVSPIPESEIEVESKSDIQEQQAQSLALATRTEKVSEAHTNVIKYNLQKTNQLMMNKKNGNDQEQKSTHLHHYTASQLEIPALGFHEVVIETQKHFRDARDPANPLANFRYSRTHVRRLLRAWHQRGQRLQEEGENSLRQIMFFKNCGMTAGASLAHDHGQVVALPIVSQDLQRQFDEHLNYFLNFHRNVFDDCVEFKTGKNAIDEENHNLVVYENEDFVAFVPFAAFSPFMIRIFPNTKNLSKIVNGKQQSSPPPPICAHFENETNEKIDSLSEVLFQVLRKLDLALNRPDFNIVVNTPPLEKRWNEYSAYNTSAFTRYFLNVTPRLGVGCVSGFEQGSGLFSNSSMPHENAELLRSFAPI